MPKVVAAAPRAGSGHAAVLKYPVGTPASAIEHRVDVERTVGIAAQALRMVHRTNTAGLRFDNRLDNMLPAIGRQLRSGRYDSAVFSGPYQRYSAQRLFEMLLERQPGEVNLAFGHGSFGLHTVLIDREELGGITDWGLAGLCDPYLDLALAARSMVSVFGAELLPTFFSAYGIDHPDPLRLDYFSLLAEFVR